MSSESLEPSDGPSVHPASAEPDQVRPMLLVLADSLSYYGPKGGLPADHPLIWPTLVGKHLGWDVEIIARIGWTSRDVWWALTQDPRAWAAVPRANAVVFAVGGMDSLPSPVPTALREQMRYIRPAPLRRSVRTAYQWLQPRLSPLGWPMALPPRLSVEYLEQCRAALAHLRPHLPVIGTLPSVHCCPGYGSAHPGRPATERALRAWAERVDVPLVDLAEAVGDHVLAGRGNPDGIHWGFEGHEAVAAAMIAAITDACAGSDEEVAEINGEQQPTVTM